MNFNFICFLLLIFVVDGLNSIDSTKVSHSNNVKKSKFSNVSFKEIESIQANDKIPDGPFCQSIVAYYVGTLQNKHSNQSYDVQFQLKLSADLNKKRIFVKVDKWNENFSKNEDFELDYYYAGNREWCSIYKDDCISPFTKKESTFKLDLNLAIGRQKHTTALPNGNYFHLLNFNFFNNSFAINNGLNKCSKHQLDGLNDDYTPNLDKLTYCLCCDEYDPNVLLGCPNDEWADKETTPKPTEPPLQPKNITCNEVVGYYNGMFQAKSNSEVLIDVEFQVRLLSDDISRRIHFIADQWNEQKATMSDFGIYAYNNEVNHDYYDNTWMRCTPVNNQSCSIHYATKIEPYFVTSIGYPAIDMKQFNFLFFPQFNNTFTLTNAIGQCTRHQVHNYDFKPHGATNETLYEYCVCCGNKYNPDPVLGCPKNPWA